MAKLPKLLTHSLASVRDAWSHRLNRGALERLVGRPSQRPLSSLVQLDAALRAAEQLGPEVKFVYLPWIQGHGDALIRRLSSSELRIAPLSLFAEAPSSEERRSRSRSVRAEPELYRRLCLRVLLKLPKTVRGVILTMDWTPAMRHLVHACKEVGLPTILVPHEGMFADRERYYTDTKSGVDYPICDHACVWGALQAEVFRERGYPAERISITGAPKFDAYADFRPELTREQFCQVYRLDPSRPIALFACQALDRKDGTRSARTAQVRAIRHLSDYCHRHGAELLVRQPPNAENVIGKLSSSQGGRAHVQFDQAPYLSAPEEAIYHAAVVCSINSTMMFEAALMGRPALSTKYLDFDSLWQKMGGIAATDQGELERLLDQCLSSHPPILDFSPKSPLARSFSAGSFDGQAVNRVRSELARLARTPPTCYRPGPSEHVFADHVGSQEPQGVVGYHVTPQPIIKYVPAMLGCRQLRKPTSILEASTMDALAYWGTGNASTKVLIDHYASRLGIPRLVLEDGLIRSVETGLSGTPTLSIMVDRKAAYYDATQPTSLEDFLNRDWSLTLEQQTRVRRCVELITKHRVSKYNHAPDAQLVYPKGSVLVIDQRFGDMSVARGMGSEELFCKMLEAAHDENPGALVLVKRHPDAVSGRKQSHFSDTAMAGFSHLRRLRLLDFETNPHALFDVCQKAYVMSSGMGFEALMRGLEVQCFGMPFYAGWGATKDRQVCERRRKQRTPDELFYAAFLVHSRYYHPKQHRVCELEELISYIVEARDAGNLGSA